MDRQHDLELILRSRTPIVVIETRDESRMLELLKSITTARAKDRYLPLFRWTVTDGLQRLDIPLEPQLHNSEPEAVVSALYTAHANKKPLSTTYILSEIQETQPLSVVMAEKIRSLRQWAAGRTVACD